jgi:hypothetical protein
MCSWCIIAVFFFAGFLASLDTLTVVEFDKITQKKESEFGRMIPKVYLWIFSFITHNLDDLMGFADKVLSPFLGPAGPSLASKQLGVVTRRTSRLEIEDCKERKYGRDSDCVRVKAAVAVQKISEAAAVLSALLYIGCILELLSLDLFISFPLFLHPSVHL